MAVTVTRTSGIPVTVTINGITAIPFNMRNVYMPILMTSAAYIIGANYYLYIP